jgi:hypothetical protein
MSNKYVNKVRCSFGVGADTDTKTFLIDLDSGVTITNDAENLCEFMHYAHPGKRVIYRDTDGLWNELVHVDGKFSNYAPYKEELPPMFTPDVVS